MSEDGSFAVAVIGGATAGAEAADIFAKRGFLTVVFEQNARPYGKVEDGLPRWHAGLRAKEYAAIDSKLGPPHVHFVPCTRIGRDIDLRELAESWGFHCVPSKSVPPTSMSSASFEAQLITIARG